MYIIAVCGVRGSMRLHNIIITGWEKAEDRANAQYKGVFERQSEPFH